jgi:hypothetical protein
MSIYVISNDINIEKNIFKVGRTKDTNTKLVSQYQRYLSGARLLLWYSSTETKYAEDEREILRFFDSNRNRTPNGFKNEWLSISFEQLKTKMDEYFGQDGEDFEEERKRECEHKEKEKEERVIERTTRVITCEYCNQTFAENRNLKKHYERCKKKSVFQHEQQIENQKEQYEQRLANQLEQHEKQIENQKEQYEQRLANQREKYEKEILNQKEQIEKLELQNREYHNQLFEIAKQPKQ